MPAEDCQASSPKTLAQQNVSIPFPDKTGLNAAMSDAISSDGSAFLTKKLSQGVTLSYENLCYSVNGKPLLQDVQFFAEPGEFVTVIGLSGAGKTTLLECLTGRTKPTHTTGNVFLDQHRGSKARLQKQCDYVMANSRLLPYVTVEETLTTAAQLTLLNFTAAERKQRVDEVISELGLEKCRNTFIGGEWKKGISTGEQRRVNIGIKLLKKPGILVLDEPTAGLDSTLAYELMLLIRRLAVSGRTVIFSLHQPTSQMWDKLDTVLILASGRVIYHGKAKALPDYFSRLGYSIPDSFNPVDFVFDLVASNNAERELRKPPLTSLQPLPNKSPSYTPSETVNPAITSSHHPGRLRRLLSQCMLTRCGEKSHQKTTSPLPPSQTSSVVDWTVVEKGFFHSHVEKVTASSLALAFEQSKEAEIVRRRIQQHTAFVSKSQNSIVRRSAAAADDADCDALSDTQESDTTATGSRKRETYFKTLMRESSALYVRSFKNAIRNPIVCSVILLVQLLQGVILGGIFWQLTGGVNQQTPWVVNTAALAESPWTRLFVNGFNGTQPLLEALEMGVDGNQSQALLELFAHPESLVLTQAVVSCASLEHPFLRQYPKYNFHALPDWNDARRLHRSPTPRETLYSLITGLQTLDYMASTSAQGINEPAWWASLHKKFQNILIPYLNCVKLYRPDLVNDAHFQGSRSSAGSAANVNNAKSTKLRRLLLPMGDLDPSVVLRSLVGAESPRFLYAIRHYLVHMGECQHALCHNVKHFLQSFQRGWFELLVATAATLNVCGALFFIVANLGFSSYDALLTFPQERLMFNRETSSGLYNPFSYFLAKNLADFPFQVFPSFLLATVFYLMAGLGHTFGQYVLYCVSCVGITFAAYGFGYFVSAACPRMEIAVLVAPITLVLWLTLAGFFLRDELIPAWISWFSYFSFYKWGFFSLVLNQFPPSSSGSFGVFSNAIPRLVAGVSETRLVVTLLALYALGFLYRCAAFVALKYTNRTIGLQT